MKILRFEDYLKGVQESIAIIEDRCVENLDSNEAMQIYSLLMMGFLMDSQGIYIEEDIVDIDKFFIDFKSHLESSIEITRRNI